MELCLYILFFIDGINGGVRRGVKPRKGNRTTDYGFIDAPPSSLQLQQQQQHQNRNKEKSQFGKLNNFTTGLQFEERLKRVKVT